MHTITLVDGVERAHDIRAFNGLFPKEFTTPIEDRHLKNGFWWLVYPEDSYKVVGFAGMVPFYPFEEYGYLKRAALLPEARGHGLQKKLIAVRENLAMEHGYWSAMVSSTHISNQASSNSFIGAGYKLFEPERPWEGMDSLYWIKRL